MAGTHGHGATLKIGSDTIGYITNIAIDGMTVDDIDVSNMDSANKWREFIAGMKDAKTITVEAVYDKTHFNTVIGKLGNSPETVTITLPDHSGSGAGSSFACSGYVNSLGMAVPFEDKISQSIGIKLTGEPTFTPAT